MDVGQLNEAIEQTTLDLAMMLMCRALYHRLGEPVRLRPDGDLDNSERARWESEITMHLEQLRRYNAVFSDLPRMFLKWDRQRGARLYWQGIPDELAQWLAEGLTRR